MIQGSPSSQELLVFGGRGGGNKVYNDLFVLDVGKQVLASLDATRAEAYIGPL